jgi:hypothetical protein
MPLPVLAHKSDPIDSRLPASDDSLLEAGMAARAGVTIPDLSKRTFDLRSLWGLATWGTSAALAVLLAVVAASSESSSRRLLLAANGPAPPAPPGASTDVERQNLAMALQKLAADRERLLVRIGVIERNLEDITGSIRRRNASLSAGSATVSPGSAAAAAAIVAAPAATTEALPAKAEEPAAAEALATAPPPPAPASAAPAAPLTAPQLVAAAPAAPPAAATEAPKPEFGIDVGGAVNFEGLRALWASARDHDPAMFEGLYPVVAVRENMRTKRAELRLIVGPIADIEAAGRLCASLVAARRHCQPVGFEGKRLAEAEAAGERKPAATPRPARRATPQTSSRARPLF